jgi:uncharacterized protein (DUF433 family)
MNINNIKVEKPRPVDFIGLYDAPEAARYVTTTLNQQLPFRVYPSKVIRWIRKGLTEPELKRVPGRELVLSFEDLVSIRIISALRAARVSFNKIYTAEKWLRDITGHPKPFATQMLWTERSDIFIEMKRQYIAASRFGQYAFDILEEHLIPVHGLLFDEKGIAVNWEICNGILLDPLIQFGSPCIKGTRIPTNAIWSMLEAGDSIEFLADSYDLSIKEIESAVAWENAIRCN